MCTCFFSVVKLNIIEETLFSSWNVPEIHNTKQWFHQYIYDRYFVVSWNMYLLVVIFTQWCVLYNKCVECSSIVSENFVYNCFLLKYWFRYVSINTGKIIYKTCIRKLCQIIFWQSNALSPFVSLREFDILWSVRQSSGQYFVLDFQSGEDVIAAEVLNSAESRACCYCGKNQLWRVRLCSDRPV